MRINPVIESIGLIFIFFAIIGIATSLFLDNPAIYFIFIIGGTIVLIILLSRRKNQARDIERQRSDLDFRRQFYK